MRSSPRLERQCARKRALDLPSVCRPARMSVWSVRSVEKKPGSPLSRGKRGWIGPAVSWRASLTREAPRKILQLNFRRWTAARSGLEGTVPKVILHTALSREDCVRELKAAIKAKSNLVRGAVRPRTFSVSSRVPWQWQRAALGFELRGRLQSTSSGGTLIRCDTGSAWADIVAAAIFALAFAVLPKWGHMTTSDLAFALPLFAIFCAMIFVQRVIVGHTLMKGEGAFLLKFVQAATEATEA
jgi:hypothetical protein